MINITVSCLAWKHFGSRSDARESTMNKEVLLQTAKPATELAYVCRSHSDRQNDLTVCVCVFVCERLNKFRVHSALHRLRAMYIWTVSESQRSQVHNRAFLKRARSLIFFCSFLRIDCFLYYFYIEFVLLLCLHCAVALLFVCLNNFMNNLQATYCKVRFQTKSVFCVTSKE